MRARNRAQVTNMLPEGSHKFASRTTRGNLKPDGIGRSTRKIQETPATPCQQLRFDLRVTLVDMKNVGGPKSQKQTRQSVRRSSLSTPKTISPKETNSSRGFSPPVSESQLRSSLNTKRQSKNVRSSRHMLTKTPVVSNEVENSASQATRRSLLLNDSVLYPRSSRKRNSDLVSETPPSKRRSQILEKSRNEEKENRNSAKCGDCGKKTDRLRLSHHVGIPICDMCESVRQTQSGNIQMSQRSCTVLLFDISKQLGGVNQTASYIVSGDDLKPLLSERTGVPVRKRFKCEIQSENDGKFRQGGEPTKHRVPKLRIKRIQSVDENNIDKHCQVENVIRSTRSSKRLNKAKAMVSTRSGRIRRPTYKIRLNENNSLASVTRNINSNLVSNSKVRSSSKINVPSRRGRQFGSSVVGKRTHVQRISSGRLLKKYSNQQVKKKSVPFQINFKSLLSDLKRNSSTVRKTKAESKAKVNSVKTKSSRGRRLPRVVNIPYSCTMCNKRFSSTVEGKSHELSHENRILKITVQKYIPADSKLPDKNGTASDANTGKCLKNLVWIPTGIIKGDMVPSTPETNIEPNVLLSSQSIKENENQDLTSNGELETSTDAVAESSTMEDTMLENTTQSHSGISDSNDVKSKEIQDSSKPLPEIPALADALEIQDLNDGKKDVGSDEETSIDRLTNENFADLHADPPPEGDMQVILSKEPENESHSSQNIESPKPCGNEENIHENDVIDSNEEPLIDVGTEETNNMRIPCSYDDVDMADVHSNSSSDKSTTSSIKNTSEFTPEVGMDLSDKQVSTAEVEESTDGCNINNEMILKDDGLNVKTLEKDGDNEVSSGELVDISKVNETVEDSKTAESSASVNEQESLEESHSENQTEDEGKEKEDAQISGTVVETLMEQIFEGTQGSEEKVSEEVHKECSISAIIETLSEKQDPSFEDNVDDKEECNDDTEECNDDTEECNDDDAEECNDDAEANNCKDTNEDDFTNNDATSNKMECNGDSVTSTHSINPENECTRDDVQKTKDCQIESYLEPISDEETECFDSFDV